MAEVVHVLDRYVPEFERYLLIEDIGCYLIAEGLLSSDEYLALTKRTSRKEAVVELLQKVKGKGPDCLQSFLHALHRSCTESSTPHQGHQHLWDIFQANMIMSGVHHLKKQKSRSVLSLLSWNKRNKSNPRSKKELDSPLLISTPHSIAMNNSLKFNNLSSTTTSTVTTTIHSPCTSRRQMTSPVTLSGGSPSDEESYRHSIHDYGSSQDSYNLELPLPAPQPTSAVNTEKCHLSKELDKENKALKNDLTTKTEQLEEQKAKVKEQTVYIEELKTENEMCKSKVQSLEIENLTFQLEASEQMTKYDSHIADLEKKVTYLELRIRKVVQEKESLKKIVQRSSMIPTRGPNSRLQRNHSLGGSESLLATTSTSLSSINEIDDLKSELNKKDAMLHSKLDHIVQMCRDLREPSKLNRKWHSDIRLVQHYHQESNSSYIHSQT